MDKILNYLISSFTILAFSANLSGQDAVKIKRLTEPVIFDGQPNEAIWTSLEKFPLVMHRPNFMANPSEECR